MKPTVGRVVHVSFAGQCLAGIVTGLIHPGVADRDPIYAVVFNENGMLSPYTSQELLLGAPGDAGTWHWPERA